MDEITRITLPPMVAQSEQLARWGGGRAFGAPERIERDEFRDRLAELSRARSEEVQAAQRVEGSGDRREPDREHGERPRREHYGPHADLHADDDDDEHRLDVIA